MKVAQHYLSAGQVLGGRYQIIDSLGQGGMAYVYLALDLESGQKIALKMMREELSDDPEFIKRFATEARAAASLDHPNIVRVLDYGQDHNVRYIVQEYVEGKTLKDLILDQGPLHWDLAVPLMIQIGLALEHAHKRGIIHRDMKPQNVLVSPQMVAKVTDFGIARASNANTITLTGGVAFGSVHYFSPEQARGGNVTERSDLYSLGIMLYEMLTGELPFDGDSSVAVAIKQLQEMPLRPSSLINHLPPALDDIIFKAIQKAPERRYQNAREFVDELDRFMINPRGHFGVIRAGGVTDWSSGTTAIGVGSGESHFEKVEEIEETLSRRRFSRIRDAILIFFLVIAAVAGLAYGVRYAVGKLSLPPSLKDSDTVVVSRYIGRMADEVEPELKEIYGTNYSLIPVKSETQEPGIIFDQDPAYGTKLRQGELHIELKYSAGKELVKIGDLKKMSESEAREWLRNHNLVALFRKETSMEVPAGKVIRTDPEGGEEAESGSSVIVFISRGKDQAEVPPLLGLSWTEAVKRAEDMGIRLSGRSVHREAGEIVELPESERILTNQKTDAGKEVKNGFTLEVEYGTAEDWQRVQNGEDLSSSKMEGISGQNGVYVMNMVGPLSSALNYLDSRWPADAPRYQIVYASGSNPADPNLQVYDQSVPSGEVINPYTTSLILYVH